MKYYIISGEASGDLHGANLMSSILQKDPTAEFRFWGGDRMQSVGGEMVEHYKNLAFMGFLEVIVNLRSILGFIKKCKKDIKSYAPDVVILIDYPGFNLRIAKWAFEKHIKTVYYITPQVWAWHKSRTKDLGKFTDRLLVILPFEKDFFKTYGIDVDFVGHPLLDAIDKFEIDERFKAQNKSTKPVLALLPGSRKQEISAILPLMLKGISEIDADVFIGCATSIDQSYYEDIINRNPISQKLKMVKNQTYDLLSIADYALVGSGTATLETALFEVPQVVCYKGNSVSYAIAKRLVDLKYISLVNLIADKEIVKELIQIELTPSNIKDELSKLVSQKEFVKIEYKNLKNLLGNKGASDRAADIIVKLVTNK